MGCHKVLYYPLGSILFLVYINDLEEGIPLLFGRSRMIVGHHRLTDELFPAAAIFCSRTHCDVINCVHCLMLSMYCFRGLPRLLLPSTYPCTTVFVIWQP